MKPTLSSSILILGLALAACGPVTAAPEVNPPLSAPTAAPLGDSILVWQRSGGFAGFCDKVVVGPTFEATVYNCKGGMKVTFKLTETQSARLRGWLSAYRPVEFVQSDPPMAADGMYVSLQLAGRGSRPADDAAIRSMLDFASSLLSSAP